MAEATRRVPPWAGLIAGGFVLAVLTWNSGPRVPVVNIDDSWIVATQLARVRGLTFGRDITFNYGPLGYLYQPLVVYSGFGRQMLVFSGLIHVALCTEILFFVRRFRWPSLLWIALSFTFALMAMKYIETGAQVTLGAALVGLTLLDRRLSNRQFAALMLCTIAASGALFLTKLNDGAVTVAVFGIVVAGSSWRRETRIYRQLTWIVLWTVGVAFSFVIWWIVAAQPLDAAADYLRTSFEIIRGYNAALGTELDNNGWEYLAAAALIAFLATTRALSFKTEEFSSFVPKSLVHAALVFGLFKIGFVRHDGHSTQFFGGVALLLLAHARPARQPFPLAGIAIALTCVFAITHPKIEVLNMAENAKNFGRTTRWVVSFDARSQSLEQARVAEKHDLYLPERFVQTIAGHSVAIEPFFTVAGYAYGTGPGPTFSLEVVPPLQSYTIFTAPLDDASAAKLESPSAPDFVLWHPGEVDYHVARFEGPQYQIALLCNYRPVDTDERWTLLARVSNQCSGPAKLTSADTRTGQSFTVPQTSPDEMAIVRFTGPAFERSALDLRTLLWKPVPMTIRINDKDRPFVSGTAGQWHIARIPACVADLGAYDRSDYDTISIAGDQSQALTIEVAVMKVC